MITGLVRKDGTRDGLDPVDYAQTVSREWTGKYVLVEQEFCDDMKGEVFSVIYDENCNQFLVGVRLEDSGQDYFLLHQCTLFDSLEDLVNANNT